MDALFHPNQDTAILQKNINTHPQIHGDTGARRHGIEVAPAAETTPVPSERGDIFEEAPRNGCYRIEDVLDSRVRLIEAFRKNRK